MLLFNIIKIHLDKFCIMWCNYQKFWHIWPTKQRSITDNTIINLLPISLTRWSILLTATALLVYIPRYLFLLQLVFLLPFRQRKQQVFLNLVFGVLWFNFPKTILDLFRFCFHNSKVSSKVYSMFVLVDLYDGTCICRNYPELSSSI